MGGVLADNYFQKTIRYTGADFHTSHEFCQKRQKYTKKYWTKIVWVKNAIQCKATKRVWDILITTYFPQYFNIV